jgi:tRNA pseudouridine55 synthase
MGHRLSSIDSFGLLNLNKPAGFSSRDVVNRVQRIVRPAKSGHAGTLDPLATGVLIVCVGPATRLVPMIHEMRKVYRATFLLGRTSQTDDVEGTIVEAADATRPSREQVLAALPEFVGQIEQRPPAFSAVHVAGRRAYKLARRGHDLELPRRTVDVHRIDLLRLEHPEVVLEIECGSGTYVRSIGRDLGERLGCGALMSELERTAIGPFTLSDAVALESLTRDSFSALLLPATAALPDMPQRVVDQAAVELLMDGRSVALGETYGQLGGTVGRSAATKAAASSRATEGVQSPMTAIVDARGRLIALAEIEADRIVPRQVFKFSE